MVIGSLFSGIGGLELGLEWAGVGHTIWQIEQDEYCRRVLARHWPDAERFEDVRDVGAANLPPVDVICGGFPCQDISLAGKGAGLQGEQSGLWCEYLRIVRELGPRYIVVENVRALLVRGLDAVLGGLADCGYDAEWSCLSACAVGAPHMRTRLFVVAYADCSRLEGRHEPRECAGEWDTGPSRQPIAGAWRSDSGVRRVAHGIPDRVDRLRVIGNAVVPQCAYVVGRRLMEIERERAASALAQDGPAA